MATVTNYKFVMQYQLTLIMSKMNFIVVTLFYGTATCVIWWKA